MPELGERDAANGTRKRGPLASLFPDLGVHLDGARDTLERGFAGLHGQLEHIAGRLQAQENPESQRLQRAFQNDPADGTSPFHRVGVLVVPDGWHWHVKHITLAELQPTSAGVQTGPLIFRDTLDPANFVVGPFNSNGGWSVPFDVSPGRAQVDFEVLDVVFPSRTRLLLFGSNLPPANLPAGNQLSATLYGEKIKNQEE